MADPLDTSLDASVVVPTYARPASLRECLAALAAQSLGRDRFEVVVVDDGSPVPVDGAALSAAHPALRLRVIRQENRGPAAARNAGAHAARGRLLAFTDDDCRPDRGWLEALLRRAAHEPGSAVGGRTTNALPENPFSSASHLLGEFLYDWLNRDPARARFLASNNLAVSADAFHAMGGFDTAFPSAAGEDREFCDRWIDSGRHLAYAPDAVVRHAHAMSFGSFCRMHYRYGTSAAAVHDARRPRGGGRDPVAPAAFYAGMLRYPFGRDGAVRAAAHAALIALSQGVYVAGYLRARASRSALGVGRSALGVRR